METHAGLLLHAAGQQAPPGDGTEICPGGALTPPRRALAPAFVPAAGEQEAFVTRPRPSRLTLPRALTVSVSSSPPHGPAAGSPLAGPHSGISISPDLQCSPFLHSPPPRGGGVRGGISWDPALMREAAALMPTDDLEILIAQARQGRGEEELQARQGRGEEELQARQGRGEDELRTCPEAARYPATPMGAEAAAAPSRPTGGGGIKGWVRRWGWSAAVTSDTASRAPGAELSSAAPDRDVPARELQGGEKGGEEGGEKLGEEGRKAKTRVASPPAQGFHTQTRALPAGPCPPSAPPSAPSSFSTDAIPNAPFQPHSHASAPQPHSATRATRWTAAHSSATAAGDGTARGGAEIPGGGPPERPAGGLSEIPAGGPPERPAGGLSEIPAGDPPGIPAGGALDIPAPPPPEIPVGCQPEIPAGGPPEIPVGCQPEIPAGGPPEIPVRCNPEIPAGGPLEIPVGGLPPLPSTSAQAKGPLLSPALAARTDYGSGLASLPATLPLRDRLRATPAGTKRLLITPTLLCRLVEAGNFSTARLLVSHALAAGVAPEQLIAPGSAGAGSVRALVAGFPKAAVPMHAEVWLGVGATSGQTGEENWKHAGGDAGPAGGFFWPGKEAAVGARQAGGSGGAAGHSNVSAFPPVVTTGGLLPEATTAAAPAPPAHTSRVGLVAAMTALMGSFAAPHAATAKSRAPHAGTADSRVAFSAQKPPAPAMTVQPSPAVSAHSSLAAAGRVPAATDVPTVAHSCTAVAT
eukprot:scaffold9302_cov68-Isochrysis_galbana.AAC.1